ncbi:MAG: bifunctional oligoribonuclease/PAP phosphatase NrnA [Candidatus Thorarchaeota archaeon]
MLKSRIESFLTFIKGKNLLIITHHPTDLDGFISSISLKFFLETFFKSQEVSIYFSELSKFTKDFLKNFRTLFPDFSLNYSEQIYIPLFDTILIIDTNNLDQLYYKELDFSTPFIFIDHHLNLNKNYRANLDSLNLIFENYSSTAEIILELFRIKQVSIPIPYKVLLASAIIADSGLFKYGNNQTIHNISFLLENGIPIQEILNLLESDSELSERIARVKGLKRVGLLKAENWLIGVSRVSNFSASVATTLINVGFDVGIIFSKKKDGTIITTRARKEVCQKTGLHLGRILSNIEGCSGGGHDGAASLNCINNAEGILKKVIDKIKKVLMTKSS